MKLDWYKKSYRRNLVDMHIEDWDDEFLSKFSPKDYCDNLKRAKIQSAMIYLQSHNGHCYFPTKVGHPHKAFSSGENRVKRLVELCHESDIDVIGYYSIIYNTLEEDKHPEWRIRNKNGQSMREMGRRYGHLCPNNPEYREFTKIQIKEMLDFFDVDGMFYDMPFWPQYCSCKYCQGRWERESGIKEMPMDINYQSADFILHMRKRAEWMSEFVGMVSDYTRELRPGITVEFNCANIIAGNTYLACTELINDHCDYTGGDLYGSLYNHSFAAKFYRTITKNQPYEYMTCRCDPSLYQHTVTKSEGHLENEIMLNVANHAATLIIDAIDPRGTMDKRVYDRLGRIFEKEMKYEPYMNGTPLADIGIMYFDEGKYSTTGQDFTHKEAAVGASAALIKSNLLFNVISGPRTDLGDYRCIIAPEINGISEERIKDILDYVERGGAFYFSGAEEPKLIKALLGCDYEGMNDYISAYIAPKKRAHRIFGEFNADYPLPIGYRMPIVKAPRADEVMAYITYPYTNPYDKRFASIHSNPPGVKTRIPAMIERRLGKGRVLWCAAPIELDERAGICAVFLRMMEHLLPKSERILNSNAPRQVEISAYERDGHLQINLTDMLCSDERLALPSFKVSVRCKDEPSALRSITSGKTIPFRYKDGILSFTVRSLTSFEMLETE